MMDLGHNMLQQYISQHSSWSLETQTVAKEMYTPFEIWQMAQQAYRQATQQIPKQSVNSMMNYCDIKTKSIDTCSVEYQNGTPFEIWQPARQTYWEATWQISKHLVNSRMKYYGIRTNCPVSRRYFPRGEQLEHLIWAHELLQPTAGCIAIFHKYCCCTTALTVLKQIWLFEIIGGMLLMCQNIAMRVYGAWIKKYCVLCSKT